ncbi:MAG TPA: hypothetical protein VL021_08980 [Brumimicrobium sp.]|nr:hypothetical protein [Brumimicrobium sp.]
MKQEPIIRASDNRLGVVAAVLYLLIVLFLLFFITSTEPDPPKVTVPIAITMGNEGITYFEINNGGGGAPSEKAEPVETPKESPADVPTQEESEVTVVKGSGSSKNNTNTTPKPSEPADPFANSSAGTGGSGTSGSGTGLGSDSGPGTGSGPVGWGMVGDRTRTKFISDPQTPNNEICEIQVKAIVDSQGKIIHAESIRSGTTTTNQTLINEVVSLVKKEIRYKEKPGAANEIAFITVSVKPN